MHELWKHDHKGWLKASKTIWRDLRTKRSEEWVPPLAALARRELRAPDIEQRLARLVTLWVGAVWRRWSPSLWQLCGGWVKWGVGRRRCGSCVEAEWSEALVAVAVAAVWRLSEVRRWSPSLWELCGGWVKWGVGRRRCGSCVEAEWSEALVAVAVGAVWRLSEVRRWSPSLTGEARRRVALETHKRLGPSVDIKTVKASMESSRAAPKRAASERETAAKAPAKKPKKPRAPKLRGGGLKLLMQEQLIEPGQGVTSLHRTLIAWVDTHYPWSAAAADPAGLGVREHDEEAEGGCSRFWFGISHGDVERELRGGCVAAREGSGCEIAALRSLLAV
jgi:hypothetical protein